MDIKKYLTHRALTLAFRLFLGGLFIYASIDKIANPADFAVAVGNYKLLPLFLRNIFAIIFPWVELICGLLLIIGLWVRSSTLILIVMLGIFIVAIAISLARGLDISCGCFHTKKGGRIGMEEILRDIALLLIAIQVFFSSEKSNKWFDFAFPIKRDKKT